jgi:hypothetical protein
MSGCQPLPLDSSNEMHENRHMRTFEYRLYPKKAQSCLLMQCLRESRMLSNGMLEMVKEQAEILLISPRRVALPGSFAKLICQMWVRIRLLAAGSCHCGSMLLSLTDLLVGRLEATEVGG